jgi:hypothetical protein
LTRHRPLTRRATTTVATVCGLTTSSVALAVAGRTLPFPPLASPSGLLRWATGNEPATVAFTAARGLAVVLVAWLALTWLLAVATRLTAIPAAVRAADGISLPFVRRLADLTAGATVVAVSLVPAVHAGATTPDTAVPVVMSDLGPTSPGTTTTVPPTTTTTTTTTLPDTTTTTTLTAPPTMTALDDASEATTSTGPVTPAVPRSTDLPSVPSSGTWVIRPGDTLWHVAERTAGDQLGRPASLAETATQLDHLITLNAIRLVVPGDADLVFPGQEFLVP